MLQEAVIAKNGFWYDAAVMPAARRVPPKRIKRIRISWFILGALSGVLLTHSAQLAYKMLQGETISESVISSLSLDEAPALIETENTEEMTALPAENAEPSSPSLFKMKVRKGDTLLDMLTKKGVPYQEAHDIIAAIKPHYNPRSIVVGQALELQLNENNLVQPDSTFDVSSLKIKLSNVETIELTQSSKDEFNVATLEANLTPSLTTGGGVINSSLYQTGVDSGVPATILGTLINAYSYDVDFQRDVHRGDSFDVMFETMKTDTDEVGGYGKMLYATITVGGQEKKIYYFEDKNGVTDYYDEKGTSVRKALLRTPVNGARLSSGFGMRKHPIKGYSRMHKGVDFAAPSGTPIYAAGDGVVDFSGRRGGYGNYVRLRHNNQYSTAYAHMKRIAKSASGKGKRVKQGEVIGYVGTTGASTGPHLHYEVLAGTTQVNPKNVKFQAGNKLSGKELASFKENIKQIELMVARLIRNEPSLAQADIKQ